MNKWRGLWLNVCVAFLLSFAATFAAVTNMSTHVPRATGYVVTAANWNDEWIRVSDYINGTLVVLLNKLDTAGEIFVHDGSNIETLTIGAANTGDVLTVDTTLPKKLKYAAPGGTGLTTKGDILYYDGGLQRLPIGTLGQVLTVSASGIPAWVTSTSSIASGTIALWNGGASTPPAGWSRCDGESSRPNFQGVYPVGTGFAGTTPATDGLGLLADGTLAGDKMSGSGSEGHRHTIAGSNTGRTIAPPRYLTKTFIIKD